MTKKKSKKVEDAEESLSAASNALYQAIGEDAPHPVKPKPEREKNPFAVALGKLGASKGGKARAASLTKRRRKEIAKKAAAKRWAAKGAA